MRMGCTAVLLLLGAHSAGAQSAVMPTVSLGLGAPLGDLGDFSEPGVSFAAGMSTVAPGKTLSWRVELVYSPFGSNNVSGSFEGSVFSASSRARVMGAVGGATIDLGADETSVRPFVTGGLGFYDTRITVKFSGDFGEGPQSMTGHESKASLGANLGGGIRFRVAGAAAFAEARYHHLLRGAPDFESEGDELRWKTAGFLPLTVGVTFGR